MEFIISVIISVCLVGALLVLKDVPVACGIVLASGAGERWSVRVLAPLILLTGLLLPLFIEGNPVTEAAGRIFLPDSAGDMLPIGLATACAVLVTGLFCRFPAVPYAFLASLAGASLASSGSMELSILSPFVLSWITAPILCALLAAGVYRIYAIILKDRNIHLAILDARLLTVSTALSLLFYAAAACNSSILFSFLPGASHMSASAKVGTVLLCVALIYPFLHSRISMGQWMVADNDLDVNPQSISSVMLSLTVVLVIFSSGLPSRAGMAATPLPVGTLYVAALTGISITRRRALADGGEILSSVAAAVLSPLLAFMAAYCLAKVMDGAWFGTLFILVISLISVLMFLFIRGRSDKDMQRRLILSREQKAYSTQKSLSALEVKAEMTEKELLDKLDGKRKELVDFALGISDQKKFMERIYDDLKEVRSMEDSHRRDEATDTLLSTLRERMYFTSEMNDFYARSEVLHGDFNRRLSEAYPNLTENERKLANLLRQGFSSKYIASLMNIAPKSVEIGRYRLRAKLGLSRSDNLVKFIKTI